MTRSVEIECHHQILYAIGKMRDLKVRMEANYHRGEPTNWSKVVEDSLEAMTDLAALIVYARTGKGGTSYLGDRNR
jgi:hypothetical protein